MTRISYRRDTAANWTTANPILSNGEPALETDTRKRKTGDGVTTWNLLAYNIVSSATTTALGVIQLAGDLAGTAAAPTVPGLAGKLSSTDPSVNNSRTPTLHATSHATGGTDPLTPANIGAATALALTSETTRATTAETLINGRALAYSIALGGI